MRFVIISLLMLNLGGCAVGKVVDVVTAPVRVAGKAVDLATTSQSEADERRGRDLRQREERYGTLARALDRAEQRCRAGKDDDCERAEAITREMAALRRQIPGDLPAERD